MRFNKRGTELSMNVIVIAAIAILVLVLLAMFVFDAFGNVKEGKGCEGLGGMCLPACTGDYPVNSIALNNDCAASYKCCLPMGANNNP